MPKPDKTLETLLLRSIGFASENTKDYRVERYEEWLLFDLERRIQRVGACKRSITGNFYNLSVKMSTNGRSYPTGWGPVSGGFA